MSSRVAAHRNSSYCTLLIVIIEFAYIVIEQVALCTFYRMICYLPPCVKNKKEFSRSYFQTVSMQSILQGRISV